MMQCANGANGQPCENGGEAIGSISENDCSCNCPTGITGDNCETILPCLFGSGGFNCENGGTITGTLSAGNCGC